MKGVLVLVGKRVPEVGPLKNKSAEQRGLIIIVLILALVLLVLALKK
jgi:hypothetical protein